MVDSKIMINKAKIINKILLPNKLYTCKNIHQILRTHKVMIDSILLTSILKYMREYNLINADKEYNHHITYWLK